MPTARTVSQYLNERSVPCRAILHEHSATNRETAHKAGIREDQVAKAVILQDRNGMVMAVIPSNSSLNLRAVRDATGRNDLEMASESDFGKVFPDCEVGAIPPLGPAYGLTTLVDSQLNGRDTIYLESGDHEALIALGGSDFDLLLKGCHHGDITRQDF